MKEKIRKWLGISELEGNAYIRLESLETLLLHQESKWNGFAVLKKHLNRPDKPMPFFGGKEIEQD